jgi:MoaA/NifB/PqqE/SkfB family radical SAM enzyme
MIEISFAQETPFFFQGKTPFRLSVSPELLRESDWLLNIDLFPKAAPSVKRRHYGQWCIPGEGIAQNEIRLFLDWENRSISFIGANGEELPAAANVFPLEEHGYALLHASILKRTADGSGATTCIATTSQTLYLKWLDRDSSPLLKQFNIPVTDSCNLSCIMCPRHQALNLKPVHAADIVVERLLAEVPNVVSVLLQGMGEPLLYPRLLEIILRFKAVARPEAQIGLTTNATLLNESMAVALCQAGLDFIYFSLDGATKEVYETVRVGADFDQVTENIARMVRLRRRHRPGLQTMINFVIQPENRHQIADIAKLAARLGVDAVTYSYFQHPEASDLNADDPASLKRAFQEALHAVAGTGLALCIPPIEKVENAHCLFLENICHLRDGRILPCHAKAPGYCPESRYCDFGSLTETSLREAWDSPAFVKFRDDVLHGRYPDSCQGCYCLEYLVP